MSLVENYKRLLTRLLPRGFLWEQLSENIPELYRAIATEFCRVDDKAAQLLSEIDPGNATDLLTDWENLLGIPDECTPIGATVAERQQQARQKLAAVGGISANFYETLASLLGFDITITDYRPFRVGKSVVGDALTNAFDESEDVFKVGFSTVGQSLVTHGWRFCFNAEIPATVNEPFKVGTNTVGQPLVIYGNELLECTIKKLKPVHTCVFFTFSEV